MIPTVVLVTLGEFQVLYFMECSQKQLSKAFCYLVDVYWNETQQNALNCNSETVILFWWKLELLRMVFILYSHFYLFLPKGANNSEISLWLLPCLLYIVKHVAHPILVQEGICIWFIKLSYDIKNKCWFEHNWWISFSCMDMGPSGPLFTWNMHDSIYPHVYTI